LKRQSSAPSILALLSLSTNEADAVALASSQAPKGSDGSLASSTASTIMPLANLGAAATRSHRSSFSSVVLTSPESDATTGAKQRRMSSLASLHQQLRQTVLDPLVLLSTNNTIANVSVSASNSNRALSNV
jgi:hypothetical protein